MSEAEKNRTALFPSQVIIMILAFLRNNKEVLLQIKTMDLMIIYLKTTKQLKLCYYNCMTIWTRVVMGYMALKVLNVNLALASP